MTKKEETTAVEAPPVEQLYKLVHYPQGLDAEVLERLYAPFDPSLIDWKPIATSERDGQKNALAFAFADPRAYHERLNEVFGFNWSSNCEIVPMDDRVFVKSSVTINGVTRTDVGEEPLGTGPRDNPLTSAVAQAFKRACVQFGLGAYLYALPRKWAEFDGKRFTDRGKKDLNDMLRSYTDQKVAESPALAALMTTPKGKALGDCTPNELHVVMEKAKNPKLAEGAETLFNWIADHFGPTAKDGCYNELKDKALD